jgi:tight adherence protein C
MYYAIIALTFSSVLLFVIGITMKSERGLIRERVERFSAVGEAMSSPLHAEFQGSFNDRVVRPFLRALSSIGKAITPGGQAASIDNRLETAGHPWRLGVAEFFGLKSISIILFVGLGVLSFRYMLDYRPNLAMLTGIIVAVIGLFLPDYILQKAIEARQARVRKALPDTIDLLTVSVEAGVGFDGAMVKVAEKVRGPLTDELVRALEEMRIGKPRMQALRGIATRVGIPEVSTFVAAIYQAEQLGVSIARVLKVQGETMRVRRSQLAREMASKLPVKMVFPLVFFIFPALFVVLLGPALMEIYKGLGQ